MTGSHGSTAAPITVGELLDLGEARLAGAGVVCAQGTDNCRDEAAALIYHTLRLDHADPRAYARAVTPAERARCEALFERRVVERQPAAYLLAEAWFCGRALHVDRRVLIPRSPFAELIATGFAPWMRLPSDAAILEIGTGSGCIAVACALAFPQARVTATDVSADALAVARLNVARHGVADRVQLVQADVYRGIGGRFDLILSNPPYVPEGDLRDMPPELAWEPRGALVGPGPDGLGLVRRIVNGAARRLLPRGWLAVEVGAGQAALEQAYPRTPFLWPTFAHEGDGIALVAAAELPGDNEGQGPPGGQG